MAANHHAQNAQTIEELHGLALIGNLSPAVPPLPESARLPDDLGADACPLLDTYVEYSRRWSPRAYDGFHEAAFLWVLSTIAARRVYAPLGGKRFPNLYIALCARTSIWAKSTTARIAIETIEAAGLRFLLAPDDSTPAAFVASLASRLPVDYDQYSVDKQETILRRLAFAAQRGWYYEEFGQKLSSMMRENGVMADYRSLLRRLDDCPNTYEVSTIGRGSDELHNPFLALLVNMTPADMAPYARRNGALWHDGFFARFAFVSPPAELTPSTGAFPTGDRTIPTSISMPLRRWHERLGVPHVEITERRDGKNNATGAYDLHIEPIAPKRATISDDVYAAFYRYDTALRDVLLHTENHDLDGTYARLPEKALRIALLLASVDNNDVIELRHWARAQQITERWRANVHHLIDQLQGASETSRESELEDKVMRAVERLGAATVTDIRRHALKNASSDELAKVLDSLDRHGYVIAEHTRKGTKRYSPADKANGRKVEKVDSRKDINLSTIQSDKANGRSNSSDFSDSTFYDSTIHADEREAGGVE